VELLEEAYERLRPWVKNHPDVNAGDRREHCRHCGSENTVFRGHRDTLEFEIRRLQCKDCGGWTDGAKVRRKPIKQR
jgi:hypothetical protein